MMQIIALSILAIFTIFITSIVANEEVFSTSTQYKSNMNSENQHLISTSINTRQLVDVPILVSSLNNTITTGNQDQTNYYVNSQAQKFRVNVSNICEKNNMRITIRLNKPFYGLIHTKDKRKKPACSVEGNGDQVYTMEISYTLVQSEPAYCGIVSHHLSQSGQQTKQTTAQQNQSTQSIQQQQQQQQQLSVALVVRLHKSIEFSDDRYFLLSCANRCSRPDCSSLLSNGNNNNQDATQTRTLQSYLSAQPINRGFVTSESIVSPVLRASNDQLPSRQIIDPNNSNTERCDILLDLKFQWLIKLCWVLSILLLMMFCTAYYLGISLCKAKSRHKRQIKKDNKKNSFKSSTIKSSVNHNKQIIYPQANDSENFSWSEAATTTTTATTANQENLDKIREDNSFLAKAQHHQQLMIPNHRLIIQNGNHQQQQQQQLQQDEMRHQMVLGRSIAENFSSQNRKIDNAQRIKRRRSIGSAITTPPDYNGNNNYHTSQNQHQQAFGTILVNHNHPQPTDFAAKQLSGSQRAKSRSQTTIHYEQRQDPFETVPFSYINNGYLSDSNTSSHPIQQQQQQLPPSQSYAINDQNLLSPTEAYGVVNDHAQIASSSSSSYQTTQLPTTMSDCLSANQSTLQHELPTGHLSNKTNEQEILRLQRWPTFKPNHCLPPQTEALSQQQQLNSQFDPQNSRQLIDLIQHKHRQQMAQANRTANLIANQQQQQQRQSIPIQTRSWR